jgi:hypothetical protein
MARLTKSGALIDPSMSETGIFQQLGPYHEGEDGGKCSLRSVT